MNFLCPVCGFPNLNEPPRSPKTGAGSHEICPSCSFQFGVTDDDRGKSYEEWRAHWIANGMIWDNGSSDPPDDWNPIEQLKNTNQKI